MATLITDPAKDPLGRALLDYQAGKRDGKLWAICDIADDDEIPIAQFFRSYEQMPQLEQLALQYCRGRVLDIGAGAGSHSLVLQTMGLPVTAIDISPGAVAVMRQRGIREVVHADIMAWQQPAYDTLLLMMNGIGLVGDLQGLEVFLSRMRSILKPEGRILLDSSDVSYLYVDESGTMHIDQQAGFYGEAQFYMKYEHIRGEPFKWLYLDVSLLRLKAEALGYECELLAEGEHYEYLASLRLKT
ncbi:MAG: class I SAM-dependent methyltransferase [Bacteroidetes bacterium]|nr:MAG: class I SAM-dependent methyltransferase [Bacteroidota bacterium]